MTTTVEAATSVRRRWALAYQRNGWWLLLLWAVAYGLLRASQAIHGEPYVAPLGTDLVVGGWLPTVLCAVAAILAPMLRTPRGPKPLRVAAVAVAWTVTTALAAEAALFLLDLVSVVLPGIGLTVEPAALATRLACEAGAVLLAGTTLVYQRQQRSACLTCGRTDRPRPPWMLKVATFAGYAAIAGCLLRLVAQYAVGTNGIPLAVVGMTPQALGFEAGFLLAGVVLPLALVRPWGRRFPRWVTGLAGRRVPRWLLLGPAFVISLGMTAYFGVTFAELAFQSAAGTFDAGPFGLAFFWVAVPAYLLWGIGLGLAALGFWSRTRPICRQCDRF
ncbi:hypothetical protein [Fodinicola feengrottensis]